MARKQEQPLSEQEQLEIESPSDYGSDEPTPEAIVDAEDAVERKRPWASDPFINLKGKMYLPARRRIQWFRGDIEPHPLWTIDTVELLHERGKRISPSRIEGGYALIRAEVRDDTGRLIAAGSKSEHSENFPDYYEKAETGAIARALAVAGYGTELAMDLDEGVAEDGSLRIADSPVQVTTSSVPSAGRGGRSTTPTEAHVQEIARLAARLGLSARGVADMLNSLLPDKVSITLGDDPAEDSATIRAWISRLSPEEVAFVIDAMQMAIKARP
jgi:hypothetical protein